jgi:predicted RNA-binding Zn-ribbon protein involved in translation (DUF1610 family)
MSSWWDKKLSNKDQQESSSLPPVTKNVILPALRQQATTVAVQEQRDPNGQTDMGTAIRTWKGGEAHRREGSLTCPRCGSKNVFSRSNGGTLGHTPAPRCFECGWNGLYEQADQASWSV